MQPTLIKIRCINNRVFTGKDFKVFLQYFQKEIKKIQLRVSESQTCILLATTLGIFFELCAIREAP